MNINWELFIKIIIPLLTAIIGAFAKDYFERKAKLVSFISHISSFNVTNPANPDSPLQIGTHITFIRNAGRKSANNITIAHDILPDYKIFPPTVHEVRNIPAGGREIYIPRLVPGEEISISYLYHAPLTVGAIVGAVKSDEGFTKVLNVMLRPQRSKGLVLIERCLAFIGIALLIYLCAELGVLIYNNFFTMT